MKWPGLFNPPLKKKEILLLRPLDFRGETIPVDTETDKGLWCRKINGVSKLFFKFGPAWTFPNVIRFLGVEGTPLTAHPTIEGYKLTIKDFLKTVWPSGSYEAMPDELRKPIETDFGVICGLKVTMPDEAMNLDELNANSILVESNAAMMKDYAKSVPKKNTYRDIANFLIPVALGFFVGMFVNSRGWI